MCLSLNSDVISFNKQKWHQGSFDYNRNKRLNYLQIECDLLKQYYSL